MRTICDLPGSLFSRSRHLEVVNLRRGILICTHDSAHPSQLIVNLPRTAEVSKDHSTTCGEGCHQHIVRLEVSVDDVLAVQEFECNHDLSGNSSRFHMR